METFWLISIDHHSSPRPLHRRMTTPTLPPTPPLRLLDRGPEGDEEPEEMYLEYKKTTNAPAFGPSRVF
jgi:hypothetical protein